MECVKSPGFVSIGRAHARLVELGVCSLDGSGDPDVEALFSRIAIVRKDLEELRRRVAYDDLTREQIHSYLNYVLRWL